jgi:acyl phosphate:glycerol-3-phosphate acyltransferase
MTHDQAILLVLIPAAYLIGSIPFGLLVGLTKGVDPRKAGSGNIGATNVGRLLGGRYFALVFTLDLLKGGLPVFVAGAVLGFEVRDRFTCLLWTLVGLAALVGHMFSIFIGFKGGKGVATTTGIILGVYPFYTFGGLAGILVWITFFRITRYVSMASMIAAISLPIFYVILGLWRGWPILDQQLPLLCLMIAIPILVIHKHRGNIKRLLDGTESRFGPKKV